MHAHITWKRIAIAGFALAAGVVILLLPAEKPGTVTARLFRVRDVDGLGFEVYATVVVSNGTDRSHHFNSYSECSTNGIWGNSGYGMAFTLQPRADLHVPVRMPMYGRRRVTVTWTPELGHDGFLNWRRHRAKLWKLLGIQSARRAKIVLDIDDSVISLTNSPPARPAKPFIFD